MEGHWQATYTDQAQANYIPRSSENTVSWYGQLLTSILIAIAVFYLSPLLPIWPESTKRAIWETFVFLTPSPLIYVIDHAFAKLWSRGYGRHEAVKFRRADFGDKMAKSEALRRLFHFDGTQTLIPAIGRARALSGLGNMFGNLRSDIPAGLGNWDNSCYQNSVIQGLASLPSFKSFIDQNLEFADQEIEMTTHQALQTISQKLNDEQYNGRSLWTPPALKSMSSWQQQDAQEYFSKIMDEVEKECKRALTAQNKIPGFIKPLQMNKRDGMNMERKAGLTGNEATDTDIASGEPRTPRTFGNPLEGLLAQRVGCINCGYCEGLSLIPFTFLTLPLGRTYQSDIRDCLDEYTAFETIEGVECSKCSVLRAKVQLERLIANIKAIQEKEGDTGELRSSRLDEIVQARLDSVNVALENCDFSDETLSKNLRLDEKNRVSAIKSRQAVVARAPCLLVLHINRSVFDEVTGAQLKNTAAVRFPLRLDLADWCLGLVHEQDGDLVETWEMDPSKSMLPAEGQPDRSPCMYELRAVITHQGHHENGHYVAYRKRPWRLPENFEGDGDDMEMGSGDYEDRWFRFSDESVSMTTEDYVLSQGGVFMLFYELLDGNQLKSHGASCEDAQVDVQLHTFQPTITTDSLKVQEMPTTHDEEAPRNLLDEGQAVAAEDSSETAVMEVKPTASTFTDNGPAMVEMEVGDSANVPSEVDDISASASPGFKEATGESANFENGYPSPPLSTCE